jgi:prepilin-type N-terminal cleavage/methylation domain-containing protein
MRGLERARAALGEKGFSLLEVLVAMVIAVIAVVGLAYSFGTGRGLIDRYATARDALAAAEQRLERLAFLSNQNPNHPDLSAGTHGPLARPLNGTRSGQESWTVVWVDDPVDNTPDANPNDYKRVTVEVSWTQGGMQDRIALSRVLLP